MWASGKGYISSISDVDEYVRSEPEVKAVLPVLAPGLVDLQVNGFSGGGFQ